MTALSESIPVPSFIERDGQAVVQAMIDAWQAAVGKPLYPAQVERLLINLVGYRELLLRVGIQDAALLNLVAYSRFPMLDLLGELVGTYRLPAVPATTLLKFTLAMPTDTPVPISAGTYAAAGEQVFATIADVVIPAGDTEVTVGAVAREAGAAANGIPVDRITRPVSPELTGLVQVTNTTITAGGADLEDDERLKARIILSPERYAAAGPANSYRYHVLAVRQDIIYCGITSPAPGRVNLYPLMDAGLPDAIVLERVRQALLAETVRPLTDWVEVHAPVRVPYTVTLWVKTLKGAAATSVFAAVHAAADDFAAELRQTTGHDLVASQWIERIQSVPGVYQCRLTDFTDQVLDESQWPDMDALILMNDGVGDDRQIGAYDE